MKFVMAFSGGKDSTLALHKMILEGHEPMGLLVMYNDAQNRSWFHGADYSLLHEIANSMEIPLNCCKTTDKNYTQEMEKALILAKESGAEACVFCDIDIADHKTWNEERCAVAGLKAILPLWNCQREAVVKEVLAAGYKCVLKCICHEKIPASFLGKVLNEMMIEKFRDFKIDLCGENGEYHTIVVDGPIFKYPVPYRLGKVINTPNATVIEIDKG